MALTDADRLQMTAMALMRHSVISGGGSGGAGLDIYDMQQIDSDHVTYTAPVDGDLFYIGSMRDVTVLPDGFALQVAKNFSHERLIDSLICMYQRLVVAKKSVSASDVLTFTIEDISGIVVLAPSGSNCVNYMFQRYERSIAGDASSEFVVQNPNSFRGLAFLGYIASFPTRSLDITAHHGKYSFFSNPPGDRGSGLFLHCGTDIPCKLSDTEDDWAASVIGASISTGSAVSSVDPIGISVKSETIHDFTAGSKSFTASITGYVVFVGSYRSSDGFLLSGFTTLKTYTWTTNSWTQTIIIAYKAVTAGDVISYTSSDRFGGAFYETYVNLSERSYTAGNASKDKANITFPMVSDDKTMFGIVGFAMNTSMVSAPNTPDLRYKQSNTDRRLTTFPAVDFVQASGETEISFPYTLMYDTDVHGIWVEFS